MGNGQRVPTPSVAAGAACRVCRPWLVTAAAVWVAAALLDGVDLQGWGSTLVVGLILGLLNAFVRPVLFWLSLPFTVVTLGFFILLLNTAMLGLTAWLAGKFDGIQFEVDSFWPAFFGALIISVVSFALTRFVNPRRVARRLG
ncbi:MAG: phage holin family protein [SAR202 cluster bacterium]|nr:phage holin family protein [SAR202 cluster bacterium]